MPRGKGRGGPRQGAQGKAYANRTDLNERNPLPTGQPYGARQALGRFQQSGPRPEPQPLPTPAGGGTSSQGTAPIDVFAPTDRPDEPITAGIPLGAGPNGPTLPPDSHLRLRAMLAAAVEQDWPYQDQLRELLEQAGG